MKYAQIQAALDEYLTQVTDLPTLQTENTRNVGVTGQPFARATLATTESIRPSSATTRYGGLYIIDLYYPMDSGVTDVNAMTDAVIAHFDAAPLHQLQGDGVTVQVEKAWRESVGRREPFYALQVKVRWHALI